MWSLVPGSGHLDDEVDPGDVEGSDWSLRQTNTPWGKIVLHALFGWSLDKDQKSLDQSKQIYALAEFKLWNLFKLVDLASVYL